MKKTLSLVLTGLLLLLTVAGCSQAPLSHSDDPVTLTMWHVYGSQTQSPLNDTINEFNNTAGKEKGIVINVVSVSNSSDIDEALAAAAKNTPGVPELPDMFTAYPRVAGIIGYENLLNWNEYFSKEQENLFVDEFVREGYFDGRLLMLPVAKSTELLFVNKTLFDAFSSDSDIALESLSTFEGLFYACEKYYDWSEGRDMFQINDFYNYCLTGMAAFGEQFVVDGKLCLEGEEFERVWQPMAHAGIYGGLCLGDGYASDRWKTGEVISNIGSTAGILYLRDYVTYSDNTTVNIETSIMPYPRFENEAPFVIHRGGGLFALKSSDEKKNEAAAYFAKWLTKKENNLCFVTKSGYLPVTDDAFEYLSENTDKVENEKYRLLYDTVNGMYEEYTYCWAPVFDGASEVQSSFENNVKAVLNAAHREYLARVSQGEDPDSVLNELVSASLAQIRGIYA